MAKDNIRSDQDTIYGDILMRKQGRDPQLPEFKPQDLSENPPAKSKWATGRGCPRDAHQLIHFEVNEETGVPWYECSFCRTRYTQAELENDNLYRIIPEDVILRYVADMERKGR